MTLVGIFEVNLGNTAYLINAVTSLVPEQNIGKQVCVLQSNKHYRHLPIPKNQTSGNSERNFQQQFIT